jgi:hypothetical protein
MLSLTRHRFAQSDHRAHGGMLPDQGWRRLARSTSRLVVGALITTGLIGGSAPMRPAQAAAQPPIGYERWTNPDANSGVDFGQTATQVFQKYADQLVIGLPAPAPPKDTRLIDIEVRDDDGGGVATYVYDVVWVKDEGDFELESWFVPGLTETELHLLPELAPQGIVAADVERYPKGNEWRYSVILQRNAGKFGWEVLTDASLDEVLDTAERRGLRVLDLDYAVPGLLSCQDVPRGQACFLATFDAILVANSGSNAVETDVHVNMSPAVIDQKEAQGFQLIDREDEGGSLVTVWVKAGQPFEILDDLSDDEVNFEHGHHGRVIDLEGTPNAFSIVRFDGSPAPVSPGLADAQQGDNDDGPRAKPGNEKAKGNSERDRKAKDKKGGKHGKGKHRR